MKAQEQIEMPDKVPWGSREKRNAQHQPFGFACWCGWWWWDPPGAVSHHAREKRGVDQRVSRPNRKLSSANQSTPLPRIGPTP